MNNDIMTQDINIDSQEFRNAVADVMNQALKSVPKPKVPSWVEAMVEFIKLHPWISLFVLLAVLAVISAIVRELLCSYLKTNDILARLKKIEQVLKNKES